MAASLNCGPEVISLLNTVHSEIAPCLRLPSLPLFCGALDPDLRLFCDSLNRSDVHSYASKIAHLLQNTDISYLDLRVDVIPQPRGFEGQLDLYNEVLRCNSEAFACINTDALQLGTSSAANDTRTDVAQPLKKLKSGKYVLYTGKSTIVGSVDNQSSHVMEESPDCSSTKITHCNGGADCNRLARIDEEVDTELNEEDNGSVVDVEILAPGVHSLECTADKDGKLCDSKFQKVDMRKKPLIKRSSKRGTKSDVRPLGVTQGASAAAIGAQQPDGPNVALPFKKNSSVWRVVESMEVFAKSPQNPHFSPLMQYEEKKREEVAIQKMMKFAYVVEKIPNLTIAERSSLSDINDMLESVEDLERNGFDVKLIKQRLNDLQLKSEKKSHLENKLEEVEGRIRKCNLEKAEAENEVSKTAASIVDLEKELRSIVDMIANTHDELMSAKNKIAAIGKDIMELTSEKGAICDDICQVQLDFEGTVARLKQIFH